MKPDDRYMGTDYEEWEDDSERVQKIRKAQGGKGVSSRHSEDLSMRSHPSDRGKRPRRVKRPDKF
ncbi:MAG: hypothetical protein P8123_01925 [bacterium]|jgi:hypothetical protein